MYTSLITYYITDNVERTKGHYGTHLMHTVETFGTAQDVVNMQQGESWSVEGPFQKIGIKSRIWDGRQIVQGLRVTLMDGTTKSFGIGKKHALNKYDQFAPNTSCFEGSTGSNITPVVQFHVIFVAKIMKKLIYYYC